VPGDKAAWAWSWPLITSTVNVKNELSYTSTSTYAFMVCTSRTVPLPSISRAATCTQLR